MMAQDTTIRVNADTTSFSKAMTAMKTEMREAVKEGKTLSKELEATGSKADQLRGKFGNLEQQLSIQNQMTQRYQQELKRLEGRQEINRKALERAEAAYKKGKQEISDNAEEMAKLEDAYKKAETAVSNNAQRQDKLQRDLAESARKERELQAELDKTGQELKKQEGYIKRVGDAYREAQDKTAGVRGALSSAGSALTRGVTLPVLAAGTAAVKLASDYNESVNKVEVSFGDYANIVKDFAKTTTDSFGLAEGTALDMASLFGDMGTSMGIPQEEMAGMATTLVGLAGDLASFKNMSLDQVGTALKGIFSGETESLKELGVVMTEANVEAWALANGYEKGMDEMTQAEKVMARYQYVLATTQNAQGDYQRTADETANSLRTMKESAKDLGVAFGQEILPYITPLIQKATELIKEFGELDEETKQNIIRIAGIAAVAGPVLSIASKGISVVNGIGSAIKGLGGLAGKTLPAVAKGLSTVGTTSLATVGGITALAGVTGYLIWDIHRVTTENERASEEFAKMGEAALEAGDDYKEAAEKAGTVEGLADEWEEVNRKIADGKTPADELADAEARRKDIEQWFIENYGDYISAEEQKNGIRDTTIDKIEEVTKKLMEQSRMEAQIAMHEMEATLPDNVTRLTFLQQQNEDLEKSRDEAAEVYDSLIQLRTNYQNAIKGIDDDAQLEAITNNYVQGLRNVLDNEEIYDLDGLDTYVSNAENELNSLKDRIADNEEEIGNLTEGAENYVIAMGKVADAEFGNPGQFDTMKQSLLDLLSALGELNTTGTISEETMGKIIDDVPELANAEDKPKALAGGVEYLSKKLETAEIDVQNLLDVLKLIDDDYTADVEIGIDYVVKNNTVPNVITKVPGSTAQVDIEEKTSFSDWVGMSLRDIVGRFSYKYASGTRYARPGLSVVNEEGPELIEGQDGSFRMASGSPALTILEQGDRVYTAEETRKMARAGGIPGFKSGKKAGEIPHFADGKSAFETRVDDFNYRLKTSEVSLAEQLNWWVELRDTMELAEEESREVNENIYKLTKDLNKEKSDDYKDYVSDMIKEDERWNDAQLARGQITEEAFLWNLGNRADQYRSFADEVLTLDYMTEEERWELRKEYLEKAEDLDLEYLERYKEREQEKIELARELSNSYFSDRTYWGWGDDDPISAFNRFRQREYDYMMSGGQSWEEYLSVINEAGKGMYDNRISLSEQWLSRMEKYGMLSEQDYLDGIGRMKEYTQEYYDAGIISYKDYLEGMAELDDMAFDRYKEILTQEVEEYYEAENEKLAADREAIEKRYAMMEEEEAQEDRQAELARLREQERIFAGAVTIEGKQKLEDIRQQIADILDQEEQEAREKEKEAALAAIDEQEAALQEEQEASLSSLDQYIAKALGIVEGGSEELAGGLNQLVALQSAEQEALLSQGLKTVTQLVDQTNREMMRLITFDGSGLITWGELARRAGPLDVNNSVVQYISNTIMDRTDADLVASAMNRAAWKNMYTG